MLAVIAIAGVPAIATGVVMTVGGGLSNPWTLPLLLLTLIVNLFVILSDLRYGLALFIVAAGLSPKMPGLYNNLRVEDFVFALVFALWLWKHGTKGMVPLLRSPMVLPFIALTVYSVVATFWGLSQGSIPDGKYAVFLQLKRVEYFLIFWVVATTVKDEAWLRVLTLMFVASGALAAGWGLMHAEDEIGSDIGPRVQGPEGENYNTLSGYLVVCIGAGLALLPAFRARARMLLIVCTGFACLGLLASYSREGYIMLVGSLAVFGMTKHRWILVLAGVALLLAVVGYAPFRERVLNTVEQIQESPHGDPGSNSLTARFRAWEFRWNTKFVKQPILGNGVGSVALSVDNEYLLRACEVGLIGLAIFLWWLATIGQQIARFRRLPGMPQYLALGVLAGFVGLLIQGMVGASFTTIRTMEPFWFLLGLLVAAGLIHRRQRLAEQDTSPGEATTTHPAPA